MKNVLLVIAAIAFIATLSSCGSKTLVKYRDVTTNDVFSRNDFAIGMHKGDSVSFMSSGKAVIDSIVENPSTKKLAITYRDSLTHDVFTEIDRDRGLKKGDHVNLQTGEIHIVERIAFAQ